jgi:hypothetical protein
MSRICKVLHAECKGIQRTALFLAVMQWEVVITQMSAVLIYFMAEAWNHDYRDSFYIPIWSESNSALLQTSVCATIESADVMNCFCYILDPLEP